MIRFITVILSICAFAGFSEPVGAVSSGEAQATATAKPWFGDYSAMQKNGVIRVLIPYSVTGYHLDRGRPHGIHYAYMEAFERFINRSREKADRIEVLILPTRREDLLEALVKGQGDLAVAGLTVTAKRQKQVDFSSPVRTDVTEVVVTQSSVPDVKNVLDLSGWQIHVRRSSSHFESLTKINDRLKKEGRPLIDIVAFDDVVEDEDMLEMVHNSIIPATVVDDYKGQLWSEEFSSIKLHTQAPVREGADIAWAFRPKSPELLAEVNAFIEKEDPSKKYGNVPRRRYFDEIDQLTNPKTDRFRADFEKYRPLFETYGKQYNIDPMLLAAQAFQESKFNARARSRVGAYGLMQLMPRTARSREVGIKNYRTPEGSVEAGAKYMRFLSDHYFNDQSIDDTNRILLSFAAYNAGPSRVSRVRHKARKPNIWFDSVEWQVARAAGIQPIHYVKYIYIYHILFTDMAKEEAATKAKSVPTDDLKKDTPTATAKQDESTDAAKQDAPAATAKQDASTDSTKTDVSADTAKTEETTNQ